MYPRLALAMLLTLLALRPAAAFEPVLIKESAGADASLGVPCPLNGNTNGTAANYRWYNTCSGYIWIYYYPSPGEGVGVLFGGPEQPEVTGGNLVKRAITYWRNVVSNFGYNVNVYVDADLEGDGCPDYTIASDLDFTPGLRWNCSAFNVAIPCDINHVIIRTTKVRDRAPTFATDGPFANECDPNPTGRSYYYGINGSACVPWGGKTDAADNFLYWLVVDSAAPCPPNATEARSWGAIKGLFR